MRCVLDVSVAVKWFFEEGLSLKALEVMKKLLKREWEIIVPEFFYPEFASVCLKKIRNQNCSPEFAYEILGKIKKMSLRWYPDRELAGAALEKGVHYELSVYDAMYVALAEFYLVPLITADDALVRKCLHRGFRFIEPLSKLNFPGLF